MDRRQQKTREAIFRALSNLLQQKNFNNITVQEIIEEANVGRSTFYAHFETKDSLLDALCETIFGHIFSEVLSTEEHHDFSKENRTLTDKLTHLLYHLMEQKEDITSVLSIESSDIFLGYFKKYSEKLFTGYKTDFPDNIPQDFIINHYVSSFAEAVKWWVNEKMKTSPEKVVCYYMALIK